MEAIKQLKAKYIRCVDKKRWEEWGELLTEDCRLETEAGVQVGRENIVKAISNSLKNGKTVHRVTMPEIMITGRDSASATWAMQDVVDIELKGERHLFHGYGYYEEDYVRTPEGWRLKSGKLIRQRVDRNTP
jgi:3-phenylpropionate/cinnamic acid dioxygenase small subunit